MIQLALFVLALTALAPAFGGLIAAAMSGEGRFEQIFGPAERLLYRLCGVDPDEEMPWTRYAGAVVGFGLAGALVVYALQRLQGWLPLNPSGLGPVDPAVAFDTAVSFATNTNWQAYGGETTMSQLTQMVGLTVQNFLSAATGLAVLFALLRGFTRHERGQLGSFWVDVTRAITRVLLPLSIALALLLASQGVVQSFAAPVHVEALGALPAQELPLGPVASQVAIKQLGTNGGGYYNANSAHPFENPTPLSNFAELLAILLLPAAVCFAFGAQVRDRRQGVVIYAAMLAIFLPLAVGTILAEQAGNPVLTSLGVDGGNLEGKEVRFGVVNSALWAAATTAASNGSVNAMHDSFTPLGGLFPMWLMQLGEVVFGGLGSGLYGMLIFALIAVFLSGLMVGRTPEYLGKKIEAHEIKMASLVVLLPSAATLIGAAVACVVPAGTAPLGNPGIHGFSEILYAFSSGANNNGSAFGGLTASGPFYAVAIGLCMWIGRYGVLVPVLSIAGSLAAKKQIPPSAGTLPTHTPLFGALLVGTVVLVGALTFLPALALGPIVEHLVLVAQER